MAIFRSSSVWLVALAVLATTMGTAVRSEGMARTATGAVAEAVAQAVAERVGGEARVTVAKVQSAVSTTATIVASPAPGARTGVPARFTMFAAGKRIGTAVATVRVTARQVRARRALARNEHITAADVEEVEGDLVDQPMRRLPMLSDAIGARLRRNVAEGEPITAAVIEVPPVVRSGDAVRVIVRIGAVEAEGRGTASGSGYIGDIVNVINSGSRRPLKARITGAGQVEIIQ